MYIHINSNYEYLRPQIIRIIENNYTADEVFCNQRNRVEKVTIADKKIVVKRYQLPHAINRIIYTFFRKSKARRAYEHALKLLNNGIDTPFPVAYVETKRYGLFHTGYLFTEYMEHQTLAQVRNSDMPIEKLQQLECDIISFTIMLHNKKILPLDYNPANIFCHYDDIAEHFSFAITDINRMQFGRRVRNSDAMKSFMQLNIPYDKLYNFILEYSSQKHANLELCMYEFWHSKQIQKSKYIFKTKIISLLNNIRRGISRGIEDNK